MTLDRLKYEVRLQWKTLLLTPLSIIGIIGFFTLLQLFLSNNPTRTLLVEMEVFLPLSAGIASGTIVAKEPALELLMTMPRTYRQTSLLRTLLIVLITGGLCCTLMSTILTLHIRFLPNFISSWSPIQQWLINQLIWFAPLLWFLTLGLCLTLITNNNITSSGILASIWLMELLLWDPFLHNSWLKPLFLFPTTIIIYQGEGISLPQWFFNDVWLTTRLELIGTAILMLLISSFLLRNPEGLLKGSSAE